MIIHKKIEDKKPHEGLEYFHKSKEPENYTDCVNLWCWECIFSEFNAPFDCKKKDELKMNKEAFEIKLQNLKDAITEHNTNKKCWQPKWKLNENFLFFSIYYNGFPNPFNIHKTMHGWSWSAFPREHHAIIKPKQPESKSC